MRLIEILPVVYRSKVKIKNLSGVNFLIGFFIIL